MLFNSKEFLLLFLPAVVIGFTFLRRFGNYRLCQLWIIAASLFFYAWGDMNQVPFLVGSIIFNYLLCDWLYRLNAGWDAPYIIRMLFGIGIAGNLALLGYCKYAGWLAGIYSQFTGTSVALPAIVQPIGISFYTIMQIMALVDAYEGATEKVGFLQYFTAISFFPCLLSGPIVQHSASWSQFKEQWSKRPAAEEMVRGLALFSVGLVKKAAIADTFAVWANLGFEKAGSLNMAEAWTVALCYALQLYFDFSGYSDMAVGLGRMFGIDLPVNFNAPFRAHNLIEFWQRWHISLSTFITGYVYIPIVRMLPAGFVSALLAILMAMLISGLWHGASWTFVVWGGMHGLAIVANHIWARLGFRLWGSVSWGLTFLFLIFSFVIFRANSFDAALAMYRDLLGYNGLVLPAIAADSLGFLNLAGIKFGAWMAHIDSGMTNRPVVWALCFLIFACFFKNSQEFAEEMQPTLETAIIMAVVFSVGISYVVSSTRIAEFLYFQF
jgi:Predicted membrane protein involved in D-alanine export